MTLLVELSGELLSLAEAEALAAAFVLSGDRVQAVLRDGPALLLEAPGVDPAALAARLGLAHSVMASAVSGRMESAVQLAASVALAGARTFVVRARRTAEAGPGTKLDTHRIEVEAGEAIVSQRAVRVDVHAPEAEVRVLLSSKAHAGRVAGRVDRAALDARASRKRPFDLPVSIHPKYARAMVNLARAPLGGRVVDPFCGTGGVLIEAAMLGHEAVGSDLDPRMVEGSRRNLEHLGLKGQLAACDVADFPEALPGKVDAVVTDPPYGKSTWTDGETVTGLLTRFYQTVARVLGPGARLVVCLPDPRHVPAVGQDFELLSIHAMRVHRSLTRHIVTLVRA